MQGLVASAADQQSHGKGVDSTLGLQSWGLVKFTKLKLLIVSYCSVVGADGAVVTWM